MLVAARVASLAFLLVSVGLSQVTWRSARVLAPHGGQALAFDAAHARTVLYGGFGAETSELWQWDGSAWNVAEFAPAPSARFGHAMVWDIVRGRLVLFGGQTADYHVLDDTWVPNG